MSYVNFADGATALAIRVGGTEIVTSARVLQNVTANASIITAGTIAVANGGTGLASYTAGDLPYATASTTISKLAIGAANRVLTSSGSAPQWSANIAHTALPTGSGSWDAGAGATTTFTRNVAVGGTFAVTSTSTFTGTASVGTVQHRANTRTRYYNSADSNFASIYCPNTDTSAHVAINTGGGEIVRVIDEGIKIFNTGGPSIPTGGGVLYCDAGALKYRGSSGTTTTLAAA